ncbi:MAG TPA: hypothetical protein DD740_09660 [Chryseobacterium sp.]|nr:hypothetical protein [Chryseobacterium sp.]
MVFVFVEIFFKSKVLKYFIKIENVFKSSQSSKTQGRKNSMTEQTSNKRQIFNFVQRSPT